MAEMQKRGSWKRFDISALELQEPEAPRWSSREKQFLNTNITRQPVSVQLELVELYPRILQGFGEFIDPKVVL